MTIRAFLKVLCLTAAIVATSAANVRAADPTVEIGASLASVAFGLGDNEGTTIGVPTNGLGLFGPGVYASFFVGPRIAVEPQIAFLWVHDGGSSHILNFSGQVDYFVLGTDTRSPYVFATAGIIDVSGSSDNPKSYGAGAGYRIPVGDRLTFRVDGRFAHFTEGGGNMLIFGASIGGVLGMR